MKIHYSKKFIKKAKKLIESRPNIKSKINELISDFQKQGRQSKYWRKKLKGNLIPLEELELSGDLRIFVEISPNGDQAILKDLGTHSELF